MKKQAFVSNIVVMVLLFISICLVVFLPLLSCENNTLEEGSKVVQEKTLKSGPLGSIAVTHNPSSGQPTITITVKPPKKFPYKKGSTRDRIDPATEVQYQIWWAEDTELKSGGGAKIWKKATPLKIKEAHEKRSKVGIVSGVNSKTVSAGNLGKNKGYWFTLSLVNDTYEKGERGYYNPLSRPIFMETGRNRASNKTASYYPEKPTFGVRDEKGEVGITINETDKYKGISKDGKTESTSLSYRIYYKLSDTRLSVEEIIGTDPSILPSNTPYSGVIEKGVHSSSLSHTLPMTGKIDGANTKYQVFIQAINTIDGREISVNSDVEEIEITTDKPTSSKEEGVILVI